MNTHSKILEDQKQKSKSLESLHKYGRGENSNVFNRKCHKGRNRTISDSSIEIYVLNESDSDVEDRKDSGIDDRSNFEDDSLLMLEQKIDRLSDLFLEQCRLLSDLKQEIRNSKSIIHETEQTHQKILADFLKTNIAETVDEDDTFANSRAKMFLKAIENKRDNSIDSSIREAVTSFLQSEELKQKMVNATAESVKQVIDGCISQDISSLYLPVLKQSHQRLIKNISRIVGDAFNDLEKNSVVMFESINKTSKNLRRALERHQNVLKAASDTDKNMINALQYAVEELLHDELKQWRQKVLDILALRLQEENDLETGSPGSPSVNTSIISPQQPASPELSILDQLMLSAEITNQILNDDVNGAFEKALQASDLVLVMAACMAAEPSRIFNPCALNQPVLLSLIQQLATDISHDTLIKCRYLEEAIINLNTVNPQTRAFLPLVVGEVRKHLSKFLQAYPHHAAHRRITLILMAADNLLK